MKQVVADAVRIAPVAVSVLVVGPTGVGKSLVAQLLHDASGRAGDFVEVDCGAIVGTLLAAELLGAEAGAWTTSASAASAPSNERTAARCSSTRSARSRSPTRPDS